LPIKGLRFGEPPRLVVFQGQGEGCLAWRHQRGRHWDRLRNGMDFMESSKWACVGLLLKVT
jgi:hypothetical protein